MAQGTGQLLEDLQAIRDLLIEEPSVGDSGEPEPEPVIVAPEDEEFVRGLRELLMDACAQRLAEQLSQEYEGRLDDIDFLRAMDYTGQIKGMVVGVFNDRMWLNRMAQEAVRRARDSDVVPSEI